MEATQAAAATALAPAAKKELKATYKVNGEDVTLTSDIIKKSLVHGNAQKVTDGDIISFISLCKYNQLNPFLGEAYLIKYGEDATMIVSKEAYFKRADACPDYEGFDAGVIVQKQSGEIVDVVGHFFAPNETLVGGWAIVYRKGRKPTKARVRFTEYTTGKSNWASKPATMIRKVAIVQALREAFPAQLGAMYTAEEVKEAAEDAVAVEIKEQANGEVIEIPVEPVQPAQPEQPAKVDRSPGNTRAPF